MRFITKDLHSAQYFVINNLNWTVEWRGSLIKCNDYVNWANYNDYHLTQNQEGFLTHITPTNHYFNLFVDYYEDKAIGAIDIPNWHYSKSLKSPYQEHII